ncbi:MAG: signal peptidase II [Acidobacteria bacterium]|nr:signal peptidase II [Acidobacteriota bacterium]MBI3655591.1 signal peptidase II [Acidobacteriota bacterium]
MTPYHTARFYLLVSSVIFLTDTLTKFLVVGQLVLHESVEIIPRLFSLTYVQNSGVAFGLLRNADWGGKLPVLCSVALLAAGVIIYYASKVSLRHRMLHWALALVLGGILGNLLDRLVHGYVIDFIDLYVFDFHWPTFNVADSAITIGVILLMLDTLRKPTEMEVSEASN